MVLLIHTGHIATYLYHIVYYNTAVAYPFFLILSACAGTCTPFGVEYNLIVKHNKYCRESTTSTVVREVATDQGMTASSPPGWCLFILHLFHVSRENLLIGDAPVFLQHYVVSPSMKRVAVGCRDTVPWGCQTPPVGVLAQHTSSIILPCVCDDCCCSEPPRLASQYVFVMHSSYELPRTMCLVDLHLVHHR